MKKNIIYWKRKKNYTNIISNKENIILPWRKQKISFSPYNKNYQFRIKLKFISRNKIHETLSYNQIQRYAKKKSCECSLEKIIINFLFLYLSSNSHPLSYWHNKMFFFSLDIYNHYHTYIDRYQLRSIDETQTYHHSIMNPSSTK